MLNCVQLSIEVKISEIAHLTFKCKINIKIRTYKLSNGFADIFKYILDYDVCKVDVFIDF